MTTQAQKKIGAAIGMFSAIIGVLMLGDVLPDGWHKYASAAQSVLAVITLWLPRVIGDAPAEMVVPAAPATAPAPATATAPATDLAHPGPPAGPTGDTP